MFTAIFVALTISGTNSQFENCDSNKCTSLADDGDSIHSNSDGGQYDCRAGSQWEACTCADGWGAVETGITYPGGLTWGVEYEYTCCPSRGSTDGTCGDFDPVLFAGCDQDKCRSPGDGISYVYECWAGSAREACTCADGWGAVETGHTSFYEGLTHYEYTCCPGKGSTNGKCGDFDSDLVGSRLTIGIIVMSILIGCCCFCIIGGSLYIYKLIKRDRELLREQAQEPIHPVAMNNGVPNRETNQLM